MSKRDCRTCVHSSPFGGPSDNGCTAWECEYIPKQAAIEAYRALDTLEDMLASIRDKAKEPKRKHGCIYCPNSDRCIDAYTEKAQYCGSY